MMDDKLQTRQETVEELTAFIDGSHNQLDELLCRLRWDKEDILGQTERTMELCAMNSHHLVPQTSLERHSQECELVAQGYSRLEQKEIPASNSFFYTRSSSVVPVFIDKKAQDDILSRIPGSSSGTKEVPQTVDRMDKAFSSAEKLAIHLAVLERSNAVRQQGTSSIPDLEFDQEALLKKDEPVGPKSRMEILAELRDYKRRRQSYRAKNVHITRRSQTEIMREVIEVQMKELQQALQGNEGSVQSSQHEECPSNPEGKRSRDTSRSPVRSRSRQDDGLNDQHNIRRSTNRSRYNDEAGSRPIGRAEARSRDPSPRPQPIGSRHDRDRNGRRRSNDGSANPLVKVEKVEPVALRESGCSPGVLEPGKNEASTSRSSTPHAIAGISVKVESESRSPSPSRARRDERDGEDRSRRHSRHKHRHKHRHHSRDSR